MSRPAPRRPTTGSGTSSPPRSTKNYTLSLARPWTGQDDGVLRIWFRGRSTDSKSPNHHVRVSWDNTVLGDIRWDNSIEYVGDLTVPKAQLTEGQHNVKLEMVNDTGATVDIVFLNHFQVLYKRRLEAGTGDLHFRTAPGTPATLELSSALSSGLQLFDVTDPFNVVALQGMTRRGHPGGYEAQVSFCRRGGSTILHGLLRPDQEAFRHRFLAARGPAQRGTNRADHLIIGPSEFRAAVEALRRHRQARRPHIPYSSITEEIFNEFSDGLPTPEGIKAFLEYAYHNWAAPAPRYVLLAGDATADLPRLHGDWKEEQSARPPALDVAPWSHSGRSLVRLRRRRRRNRRPDDRAHPRSEPNGYLHT